MSRSGYSDDCDGWQLIMWRGAVASGIRGARGQQLLREMVAALDAMPVKSLIADDLVRDGEVCALGAVGMQRGIDMSTLDPEESEVIAKTFNISEALAREIEFLNDDDWSHRESREQRWQRMRNWAESNITKEQP